ncbi:type II secretion system F family protein [Janthinobacterium sp. 17J80-10]|uniref:type II secretion system F family protein n=1 Tax=Janthinobacterium sp. 17J80-10 TaxID=2497863 RepID=UPI001F505AC1|nr:type II secretion system F family protein [Janthinobacterium sp. 17J80-10]
MISDVPLLERLFLNLPQVNELQRLLHQAGLSWTVSRLVLTCAALGAGLLGSAVLLHQPTLASLIAGAAGAGVPVLLAINKRRHRLGKIEQQLPDAIDLLNRALRSGHAFSSGLKMIGEEMPEPIASEFRIVHDEVNFGVSLQQALTNLSQRIPLTDLRYFVVSVLIQRDSGGNLTEVLGNLSHLIRERLKLAAKVKVLSSEGRLSAWILVIMPFALGAIMNIVNPGFMAPLWTDPIGIAIVKYMLTLMFFGVLIMRKIIKIRY